MTQRRTVGFAAASAVAGFVIATGAVAAAGPWDGGQRKAERVRAAAAVRPGSDALRGAGRSAGTITAPPVLGALRARGASTPRESLAGTLEPLLGDSALGSEHAASVVDAATGEQLYGSRERTAYTPASTVKLATAAAALAALGPDHRIETTVVAGGDGIVLVGGGDPTLTAAPPGKGGGPRFASLADLADATARSLKARGTTRTRLAYDASRYSGPARHPIGINVNIAPVSALMVDEGRLDDSNRGPADRTAEPAADAARKFADLLRERGVEIEGDVAEGRADAKAARVAAVASAPLADLVERALTYSDNDIAEALARQTALASGQPASFEGAARAVTDRLAGLGLPMEGVRIADGSGLDRADQVSAAFLARLLARSADPRAPRLRPVLTGLPVAGFSGTLRDRYPRESAGRAAVRAKTGTLTGVNTLAGTAVTPSGRLVTFAFMASGTTDADAAQQALDKLAAAVASTG
ncbi:D-alanyl-D-alanine carboxypeptidase/D-alanyl-D-alanine endopeptidase [Streptomyces griseocarneus]|uniref:D-alanyl-D-alanine carboxypeptidase/D-alanyl-D-alanine endopeptidase n=1 Tax=Streptomyces griseocarneus TaxID=51201 RepID=UPI00167EA96E|nr:D-alanyl-D-alanine carboxypeptidase/D-alanyl-D-alanine-endopeptidase [Streptomyces griseocarneus]MBZ6477676.1 D-alanyl-D-alanine carboxypeptidase/D-alanyl-D-alanine-endopeptidase [Streptomyces griseocarneus]GHG81972.1 D-alanyl-D-alanine carboxypeptidase [Streptomyces griseocarneus]